MENQGIYRSNGLFFASERDGSETSLPSSLNALRRTSDALVSPTAPAAIGGLSRASQSTSSLFAGIPGLGSDPASPATPAGLPNYASPWDSGSRLAKARAPGPGTLPSGPAVGSVAPPALSAAVQRPSFVPSGTPTRAAAADSSRIGASAFGTTMYPTPVTSGFLTASTGAQSASGPSASGPSASGPSAGTPGAGAGGGAVGWTIDATMQNLADELEAKDSLIEQQRLELEIVVAAMMLGQAPEAKWDAPEIAHRMHARLRELRAENERLSELCTTSRMAQLELDYDQLRVEVDQLRLENQQLKQQLGR